MIKLNLAPKPAELTDDEKARLVAEYKATGDSVWKKPYIEKTLLAMSNNKCAYSEQVLDQESTYMEIDHFKCKTKYPNDVVTWGNLLPSCKKCNTTKSEHDVIDAPIVNPLMDVPKDFLYVQAFRYYARNRNKKGKTTIDILALNDYLHFVRPRAQEALSVADQLETLFEHLQLLVETGKSINRTISKIKSLLQSCGPLSSYSAVISTYILYECDTYQQLEDYLRNNGFWDKEFDSIKNVLSSISLEK